MKYLAIAVFNTDDGPFCISDNFPHYDADFMTNTLCERAGLTDDSLHSIVIVYTDNKGNPSVLRTLT
jgi:hypothetical protein